MTKPGRIPCVVPFCRRTASEAKFGPDCEIICGKHWRMAPATFRRRKTRLARLYGQRFGDQPPWSFPAGSPKRLAAVKLARLCRKSWDRVKRAAIEAAAGIS